MKWPFVSRAKYDALVVELDAERKRARRRERRQLDHSADAGKMIDAADATADTATDAAEPRKPDPVAQAIRQVAGLDRALARHLRAFAEEARARDMNERDIVKAIRTGQEVRV
jgi:hypothetical protein